MGSWRRLRILLIVILSQFHTVFTSLEPKFDVPMVNVTAQEKSTAELPCSVSSLGTYQVVWTDQFSTLLTYEDRRIIDDERLSVERPYTRDWNLHIRDVRYSDQGIYNCQINTNPVKVKTVNLIVLALTGNRLFRDSQANVVEIDVSPVVVRKHADGPASHNGMEESGPPSSFPARIVDQLSTSDVIVKEGETVTLICNVTGTPHPTVTWYRLETDPKGVEKQSELCPNSTKVGVSGEVLIIHNVTRACGDGYECVAFNGVPPAVSRVVQVFVEFAPEIYLPNRRIGQEKGKETILECTVSAFPHAVTMWQKDGEKIGTSTLKYRVEVYDEEKDSLTLSLRIFDIQESDFGTYTCVAANPLGDDEEAMVLYDYAEHTRTTMTTFRTTTTVWGMYTQPTLERIYDPFIRPVIRQQQTASGHHYMDHDLEPESQNQVTPRPLYTPPYGSSEPSDKRFGKSGKGNSVATIRISKWTIMVTLATTVIVIHTLLHMDLL